MKYHIYLFRHGQTEFNQKKIFTGWTDSLLTKKGIQDAKTVAEKLQKKRIDVAFQTHLSRSKDSLKEVLTFHPECRFIITDDRMIERDYGKLNGRTHESIVKEFGEKQFNEWHRSYKNGPPGGESIQVVEKRVNEFIRDLVAFIKKARVHVVISAHNNSMRPFRRYFEKLSVKQMMKLENPWDDYFDYTIDVPSTIPLPRSSHAYRKKPRPKAGKAASRSRARNRLLKKESSQH